MLSRMRCSGACGGRVEAAWLETNARVRPRRVPLRAAGGAGVAVAGGCLDNRHDRPIMTAGWVLGSPCVLKV